MLELLKAQPAGLRAAVQAALAGPVIHMSTNLWLDFADGGIGISTRRVPFTDLQHGRTYAAGSGLLVSLPQITGGVGQLAPWREYALGFPVAAPSDPTLSDLAEGLMDFCGDVANYRTREAVLSMQLFDAADQVVGWPIVLDRGLMDRMRLTIQREGVVVTLQVESLLSRKGVPPYGMQTYRDQKRRHPTDEGLEFVTEAQKPVVWTKW